jgi:hypothetical protein
MNSSRVISVRREQLGERAMPAQPDPQVRQTDREVMVIVSLVSPQKVLKTFACDQRLPTFVSSIAAGQRVVCQQQSTVANYAG